MAVILLRGISQNGYVCTLQEMLCSDRQCYRHPLAKQMVELLLFLDALSAQQLAGFGYPVSFPPWILGGNLFSSWVG